MGVDNFVNEVVNMSYKLNPLEADAIKSEAEFVEAMNINKQIPLNVEWFDALFKISL